MSDQKKKPEDETSTAQAGDTNASDELSDDELGDAAGGLGGLAYAN